MQSQNSLLKVIVVSDLRENAIAAFNLIVSNMLIIMGCVWLTGITNSAGLGLLAFIAYMASEVYLSSIHEAMFVSKEKEEDEE